MNDLFTEEFKPFFIAFFGVVNFEGQPHQL
jgi:hypothetical protein